MGLNKMISSCFLFSMTGTANDNSVSFCFGFICRKLVQERKLYSLRLLRPIKKNYMRFFSHRWGTLGLLSTPHLCRPPPLRWCVNITLIFTALNDLPLSCLQFENWFNSSVMIPVLADTFSYTKPWCSHKRNKEAKGQVIKNTANIKKRWNCLQNT